MKTGDRPGRTILRVKRPYNEEALDFLRVLVPKTKRRRCSLSSMLVNLSIDETKIGSTDDSSLGLTHIFNFARVGTVGGDPRGILSEEPYAQDGDPSDIDVTKLTRTGTVSKRPRMDPAHHTKEPSDVDFRYMMDDAAHIVDVLPKRKRTRREEKNTSTTQNEESHNLGKLNHQDAKRDESKVDNVLKKENTPCVYDLYEIRQSGSVLDNQERSTRGCSPSFGAVVEWADDMPSFFTNDSDQSSIFSSDVDAQSVDYPSTPEDEKRSSDDNFFVDFSQEDFENGSMDNEDFEDMLSLDSRTHWRKRLSGLSET